MKKNYTNPQFDLRRYCHRTSSGVFVYATMDESKAYQSYMSSHHLRQMCQRSNNMSTTSRAVHNGKPVKKNIFRQIFDRLIGSCTNLFTETPSQISHPSTSLQASGGPQDEGFVEISVGEQFAEQLIRKFGDSKLILPKGFEPVIEVPEALGRQLYVAYVEAVFRQQEAHDRVAAELIEEDEAFARKLQEEDDREQLEGAAASKVFLEEYKPASYTLPKKNAIPEADSFNFDDDVAIIDVTSTPQQYEHRIDIEEKKSEEKKSSDKLDSATFPHSATFYRDQAQKYLKKREQFYDRARQCIKSKDKSLAKHYFSQAQELTRLYEQANNMAAAAFLMENKQKNPSKNTIDLHHLYVKEAIQALDIFLDDEIFSLQSQVTGTKSLMVITGRGKHSPDGIPKIKPAVMDRLAQRSLRYTQINPGLLKVRIHKDSYLTNDLTRDNVFNI